MKTDNNLMERVAIASHEELSSLIRAFFSICSSQNPEGHVILDRCYVEQLKRLSSENFENLEEEEKNEIRIIADRYVKIIEDEWPLGDSVCLMSVLERLRSCGNTFSSEMVFHALSDEEPILVHEGENGHSVEDKILRTISWLHRRAYLSILERDSTRTMWRLIRAYEDKP